MVRTSARHKGKDDGDAAQAATKVFEHQDGTPMVFLMGPGARKKKLRPLIEKGGGKVVVKESDANGKCYRLIERGTLLSTIPPDCYWDDFITSCSDSNAALDIELSRAKKSSPRKIAGGSSKYVPDGNGRKKMRTVWTDEQDVEISNAVLIAKRETVHKPGGDNFWLFLAEHGFNQDVHTWQSMKERWKRMLKGNLNEGANPPTIATRSGTTYKLVVGGQWPAMYRGGGGGGGGGGGRAAGSSGSGSRQLSRRAGAAAAAADVEDDIDEDSSQSQSPHKSGKQPAKKAATPKKAASAKKKKPTPKKATSPKKKGATPTRRGRRRQVTALVEENAVTGDEIEEEEVEEEEEEVNEDESPTTVHIVQLLDKRKVGKGVQWDAEMSDGSKQQFSQSKLKVVPGFAVLFEAFNSREEADADVDMADPTAAGSCANDDAGNDNGDSSNDEMDAFDLSLVAAATKLVVTKKAGEDMLPASEDENDDDVDDNAEKKSLAQGSKVLSASSPELTSGKRKRRHVKSRHTQATKGGVTKLSNEQDDEEEEEEEEEDGDEKEESSGLQAGSNDVPLDPLDPTLAAGLNGAIAFIQSVGNWSKLEVWQALYVMSGHPKSALGYLQKTTGRGGACFLTATPWHPKDTAALHESGDSQDSQAGEVQHEKVQAKYGEDATRLRLLYYADDQDDS